MKQYGKTSAVGEARAPGTRRDVILFRVLFVCIIHFPPKESQDDECISHVVDRGRHRKESRVGTLLGLQGNAVKTLFRFAVSVRQAIARV